MRSWEPPAYLGDPNRPVKYHLAPQAAQMNRHFGVPQDILGVPKKRLETVPEFRVKPSFLGAIAYSEGI